MEMSADNCDDDDENDDEEENDDENGMLYCFCQKEEEG